MGRELSGGAGELHGGLVRVAKERELADWEQFKVFKPIKEDALSKAAVHTRWALTWEMVGGEKDAKARPVARGYRDPDLRKG